LSAFDSFQELNIRCGFPGLFGAFDGKISISLEENFLGVAYHPLNSGTQRPEITHFNKLFMSR